MAKRIIQVPVDDSLLGSLDSVANVKGLSRSEIIRRACVRYLRQLEYEKMDETYREGYTRFPEDHALAESQASLAGQFLEEENW
jgi:metal-responsive CopG/Arc/MetJ family transcriptional regulator